MFSSLPVDGQHRAARWTARWTVLDSVGKRQSTVVYGFNNRSNVPPTGFVKFCKCTRRTLIFYYTLPIIYFVPTILSKNLIGTHIVFNSFKVRAEGFPALRCCPGAELYANLCSLARFHARIAPRQRAINDGLRSDAQWRAARAGTESNGQRATFRGNVSKDLF